jgi:hypothetical protein
LIKEAVIRKVWENITYMFTHKKGIGHTNTHKIRRKNFDKLLNQNGSCFYKIVEPVNLTRFCWLHIFAELTTHWSNQIIIEGREIDDTQVFYSQEDEIIGMNVCLGMEETNSNGHGGVKEEDINMVETLIKL